MAWCFSTRASVATVLTTHPCVSRCLRVNGCTVISVSNNMTHVALVNIKVNTVVADGLVAMWCQDISKYEPIIAYQEYPTKWSRANQQMKGHMGSSFLSKSSYAESSKDAIHTLVYVTLKTILASRPLSVLSVCMICHKITWNIVLLPELTQCGLVMP